MGHFVMKIAGLPVVPAREMRSGGGSHDFRVRGNVFVTKCGLNQLTLGLPRAGVVGEKTITQDEFESDVIAGFLEVGGQANEHGFDVVGMGELADGGAEETVQGNVAVFPGAPRREADPIVYQMAEASEEEVTAGARRRGDCCGGGHREMVRKKVGSG